MKLKFTALPHAKVAERHQNGAAMARPHDGGSFRYVGWEFDANAPGHAVVSKAPYECDSSDAEAQYLARCVVEGDLSAADDATAQFCGVKVKAAKSAKGDS